MYIVFQLKRLGFFTSKRNKRA